MHALNISSRIYYIMYTFFTHVLKKTATPDVFHATARRLPTQGKCRCCVWFGISFCRLFEKKKKKESKKYHTHARTHLTDDNHTYATHIHSHHCHYCRRPPMSPHPYLPHMHMYVCSVWIWSSYSSITRQMSTLSPRSCT